MESNTPSKTCHAAELVDTVAGMAPSTSIPAELIQQAQQAQDFAKSATLDNLAATSVHFAVPLQLLRRERELAWDSLEIAAEDRPAVLEEQRRQSADRLVAWIDALGTFGLLTPDNADELRYQVLDLRDDTPGATAKDSRKPAGTP